MGLELIVISKQGTFTIKNSTQDFSLKKKKTTTNKLTTVSLSFMDVNDKYYSFNWPCLRQFETLMPSSRKPALKMSIHVKSIRNRYKQLTPAILFKTMRD